MLCMTQPITVTIEGGNRVQRLELIRRLSDMLEGKSVVTNGETKLKVLNPTELYSDMEPVL